MAELNDVAKIRLFNKIRDKGLSVCPFPLAPPAVFALFAAPAAAGAEERARAGGPADRRRLLRHHPGEAGPEEPAGGGGLQRRPRPGPQRAAQHRQHAAGVVSGAASHSHLLLLLVFEKSFFHRFLSFWLPPFLPLRCTGCEAVLCGIEEQVSRANQYRESQLKVKIQVETEVSRFSSVFLVV